MFLVSSEDQNIEKLREREREQEEEGKRVEREADYQGSFPK